MTLSNALLGYEPVLGKGRDIVATRLSVVPSSPGKTLAVSEIYSELSQAWPEDAGDLLIDVRGSAPDEALAGVTPVGNCVLGLGVEWGQTPEGEASLTSLQASGFRLYLAGDLISRLSDPVLAAIEMTVVSAGATAEKPFACDGLATIEETVQAFEAGAERGIGWPIDDLVAKSEGSGNNPSFEVIGRLLALVNANADADALEPVFKQDPSLSFRLLRYLNSAAFGLRVEVQSIQHAVMMIGMQRLKKWLALLLATAAKDPDLKPLMFASLRRGFLLEALVGDVLGSESKDEAFILGVFSLLDKLFNESFESLFSRLQIPEGVHDALVAQQGQYMPYLNLVTKLEARPGKGTDDAMTDAFVERADCNTALVKALGDASMTENQK
ncbi:MAG: HDOD domain-containing protein [Burkholderiaceae bacterium]